jgi:ribosomal protein S12 methylthiotransferase
VQRYGYKLRKELPEVDGWIGTGEIHRIGMLLDQEEKGESPVHIATPAFLADHTTPRVLSTPFYTAYLKISEGCSHKCSYCIIPKLRGPFRSRNVDSLVREAEWMVGNGVKEINLVAQDTTMYGRDLARRQTLEDLLEKLLKVEGLRWLRVLYSHPARISERLLDLMDHEEVLCPYLDIPLQHVNPGILLAMGRDEGEDLWKLIERVRAKKRYISLRTTFIVGFPGETEKGFKELYQFVKEAEFDHLGVFAFSPEKGTPADRLDKKVRPERVQERLDAIMKLQRRISRKKNLAMVGETLVTLLEGVSPETDLLLSGRTAGMAPEVDGRVLINKGTGKIGEMVSVLITEAHPYDLVGEIV